MEIISLLIYKLSGWCQECQLVDSERESVLRTVMHPTDNSVFLASWVGAIDMEPLARCWWTAKIGISEGIAGQK